MSTTSPGSRRAGFTVMELMITIGLAAFLLAVGVGAILKTGQTTAYRQAAASIAAMVGQARNASSYMPSALVLEPEEGVLYGLTAKPLQELHFDPLPAEEGEPLDVAQGIGGLKVREMNGQIIPGGGVVGGGLRLQGGIVNCGAYSAYDVTDGFSISIWIQPEGLVRGSVISKGDAFDVRLQGRGQLNVRMMVDDQGGPEQISRTVQIPDAAEGDWFGITVSYDRQQLVVFTDHGYGPVERARIPETRALRPDPESDLILGNATFSGMVDDFRFSGIHRDEPLNMPVDVVLLGESRVIRFADGGLDPNTHPGVEQIQLQYGQQLTTLEIGQNGAVQGVIRGTTGAQAAEEAGPAEPDKE